MEKLLQDGDATDDGQSLDLTGSGVDDTQNHQDEEADADDGGDQAEDSSQSLDAQTGEQTADKANDEADDQVSDQQNQTLIAVEAGVLGVLGSQNGNQDQDAQVSQNSHDLVLLNVLGSVGVVNDFVFHNRNSFQIFSFLYVDLKRLRYGKSTGK